MMRMLSTCLASATTCGDDARDQEHDEDGSTEITTTPRAMDSVDTWYSDFEDGVSKNLNLPLETYRNKLREEITRAATDLTSAQPPQPFGDEIVAQLNRRLKHHCNLTLGEALKASDAEGSSNAATRVDAAIKRGENSGYLGPVAASARAAEAKYCRGVDY